MKRIIFSLILFFSFQIYVLAQPPGCASQKDVLNVSGQSGLIGEYVAGWFNDNPSYFPSTVTPTSRVESNINFTTNNWGAIVPPAGGSVADADNFSSRYRGSIYIATAGVYTFYLTSDDGSYLWIDNDAIAYPTVTANALVKNGGLHGDITISASVNLTAGLHNIQIQYGEQGGGNHLIFEYSSTSPVISKQVVPNSILCTGIQPAIVVPPATAPPGCNCAAGVTSQYYTGYYNDVQTFFTSNTPAINRVDPQIAFTTDGGWGSVCPPLAGTNASPETYSTRFTGQVYIATAASYTFYLTSDDASYLWLDGNALATNPTTASSFINNGSTHSAAMVSAVATLSVGLHDFKIHYGENTGNNICYLEYASTAAGISKQYIPQSAYCSCSSIINTLPIELLNFTADVIANEKVILKWQTASEINNKQFNIERSMNGIDFNVIGSVLPKGNGTSTSLNTYDFIDRDPEQPISYYRLKQIDLDGTFKQYKIISVELNKEDKVDFVVFPNPNSGVFSVSIKGISVNNTCEIQLFNLDGRMVYQKEIDKNLITDSTVLLKLDTHLNAGLYIANCIIDGVKIPVKIMIH